MTIDSNWDAHKFKMGADKASKRALAVYMSEWRRFAEPYVRFRTGATMKSAHMASDLSRGLVIYDTPYAHYTYTNTNSMVNRNHHPEARPYWGKYAYERHGEQMLARAKKEYEKG